MGIATFISFAHGDKERAIWLSGQLRASGHDVVIEDDFGAGPPRREMTQAVSACDLVVALVTPHFLVSMGTQRELDLAEAYGKSVIAIFAGVASRSDQAAPYRAYRRLELNEPWTGNSGQWERLQEELRRVLDTERSRSGRTPEREVATSGPSESFPSRAMLVYDVEDCEAARRAVALHPGWMRPSAQQDDDGELPRILIWSVASADPHSTARLTVEALDKAIPVYYLARADAPAPPSGAAVIEDLDTPPHRRPLPGHRSARAQVQALLTRLAEANEHIAGDTLVERFSASGDAADIAADLFDLAVRELRAGDELRLRAVYEWVLTLRFLGDWQVALHLIRSELVASPAGVSAEARTLHRRLQLEQASLDYELGTARADEIKQVIRSLQLQFRRDADLGGYVQASRLMGNVLRERGEFEHAEDILWRTIGIAEYLAEAGTPPVQGALALAECHRELCVLYTARGMLPSARDRLGEARRLISEADGNSVAAGRYLSAVLDYAEATLIQREMAPSRAVPPTEKVLDALDTLCRFENPIRLASIYDWLGRAWTHQIPRRRGDLERAKSYLQKALRIRQAREHVYPLALSKLSLGDLYGVMGDADAGIEQYEEARQIFNSRGLRPALARSYAALARAHYRKSRDDANAAALFQSYLVGAEQLYREIHLDNEALELRFELEHSGRRPIHEVPDETPLVAVGEFLVHRWIRARLDELNPPIGPGLGLVVGVGDDAAVVSVSDLGDDGALVFTTDAAPGSLARPDVAPEYVGRFAVVQALSDVLAMGARPVGLLLNLFLARTATVGYLRRVVDAVVLEAGRYGAVVLGGDLKEREEQSVGCVGIGRVRKGDVLTRSHATPGQAVGITLASASGGGSRLPGFRWAQELIDYFRIGNPAVLEAFPELADIIDAQAKYDLLYLPDRVMDIAAASGLLSAAMDTSDGVLSCLEILGRMSGVGFELDEESVGSIIDDRAAKLAEILDIPRALLLFNAGHDWEIVFTCDEGDFPQLAAAIDAELQGNGTVALLGRTTHRREQDSTEFLLRRLDGTVDTVPYYTDEKFVPRSYQDRPGQWLSFASRFRPPPTHRRDLPHDPSR